VIIMTWAWAVVRSSRPDPLESTRAYLIGIFVGFHDDQHLYTYAYTLDLRRSLHRDHSTAVSGSTISLGAIQCVGAHTYYERCRNGSKKPTSHKYFLPPNRKRAPNLGRLETLSVTASDTHYWNENFANKLKLTA
jgi:hypothetical protein